MVSLHVLAFFWVRRRLDFLFMLACGVVRCFSLSIGELVYYKLLKNLQLFHTRDSPFYSECKDNKFSSNTNHISAEKWGSKIISYFPWLFQKITCTFAQSNNCRTLNPHNYGRITKLTKEECLRSQIVTLNEAQGKHLKYMPYAFTMLGTAMHSCPTRRYQYSPCRTASQAIWYEDSQAYRLHTTRRRWR